MDRPTWDETCMDMVKQLERRTSCIHYKVGCIVLNPDHVIVAWGYNGPPTSFPHCNEVGCNKEKGGRCIGAHAEMNAVVYCVGSPYVFFKKAQVFVSVLPCNQCMKQLVNCGISQVTYSQQYLRKELATTGQLVEEKPDDALIIAEMAGIEVTQYDYETKNTTTIVKGSKHA